MQVTDYMGDNNAFASNFTRTMRTSHHPDRMDYGDQFDRVIGTLMPGQARAYTFSDPAAHGLGGRWGEHSFYEKPNPVHNGVWDPYRGERMNAYASAITGDPNAEGTIASYHDRIWDPARGAYPSLGAGSRVTHPHRGPEHGPETMAYHAMHAEAAYRDVPEHNPHKPRIIHPRRDDVTDRIASYEAGVMSAIRAHANTQHVEYYPGKWRKLAHDTAAESEQNGPLGRFVKTIASFVSPFGAAGQEASVGVGNLDLRTPHMPYCVDYAGDVEGMTSQELAASLVSVPTVAIENFMRENPTDGNRLMSILQEIAQTHEPLTKEQDHVLNLVIHLSLQASEFEKIYDPRMLEFVLPHDPTYIETSALRRKIDDIQAIICDPNMRYRLPPESEIRKIIFPLALHLRNQGITPTENNLVPEIDGMLDTMKVIDRIAEERGPDQLSVQNVEYLLNEEEAEIATSIEPNVIDSMIVSRDLPDAMKGPPIVYPESNGHMEADETISGMGPQRDRQTSFPMNMSRAQFNSRTNDRKELSGRGKHVGGSERSRAAPIDHDRGLSSHVGPIRYSTKR